LFFAADVKDVWTEYRLMERQDMGRLFYKRTKSLKLPWMMREAIERYQKEIFLQ
jgi:hypothetical protein